MTNDAGDCRQEQEVANGQSTQVISGTRGGHAAARETPREMRTTGDR